MPQNFLHSQDKAVIAKSGINRQGKQKYAVNYNGKVVDDGKKLVVIGKTEEKIIV